MNTSVPAATLLRRITAADNAAIARVIRQVSAENGLTADKGYTVADPNLDELYELYSQPGSAYWVVEKEGEVVGGGGVAPLACSEPDICELQKMYFMTSARGQGLAKKLALLALDYAMSGLYGVDPARCAALYEDYGERLILDLNESRVYWSRFEGPAATVSRKANDAYLKVNAQFDGVRSYGRMVDLLLARRRTQENMS